MNSKIAARNKECSSSSSSSLPKKMVIKPFKTQPKLPENYEDVTWGKLALAVRAVNSEVGVSISKEELYRAVEDLCMHKFGSLVYDNLMRECQSHIFSQVDSLTEKLSLTDSIAFLVHVDSVWVGHCTQIVTVRNIFLYLDRSYALQTHGIKSIWDMGLELFRKRLEFQKEVESKLIIGLLAAVEAERLGLTIDRDVVRRLLSMMVSIGLYTDKFESVFLADSRRFFINEGQSLIQSFGVEEERGATATSSSGVGSGTGVKSLGGHSLDPASYFLHVERRLQEASDMVHRYLDCSSKSPLLLAIDEGLLLPHVALLVERGLGPLLDATANTPLLSPADQGNQCIVNLKRMFNLMERVGATDQLKIGWGLYIRRVGEAMTVTTDAAQEKVMIENLLVFQESMDIVLRGAFANHEGFRYSLKSAFEHFINLQQNKPAKLLADYVDRKMRGERGLGHAELDGALDKVMSLFRVLQSKDTFERFYKNKLSKRLLLGKSASYDLEKNMLTKLKTECGSNFTSKLEGMFQDVELSRDAMTAFTIFSGDTNKQKNVPDCYFQLLTAGYWPSSPSVETLTLPLELLQLQDKYTSFYCAKYQGRRLQWAHAHQRCVLTARFPKGKKELEVSLFQTVVLMAFNRTDTLTYTEIRDACGIEDGELRRTLQSLASGIIGTRVLVKTPKGKDVADSDTFSYNADFFNKLFHIKFNSIQLRETEEEIQRTHEEVFRDRQYQVDAVIVRTMKSRKRLAHTVLMGELMSQLRFPATSTDLKKRIESLIEREYLERDADDGTYYKYLA